MAVTMHRQFRYAGSLFLAAWLMLGLQAPSALACSVPVFRYALERWHPAPYEVAVFHQGALSSQHQAWVARLSPDNLGNKAPANLSVRTVDLSPSSATAALSPDTPRPNEPLPWMKVRRPGEGSAQGELWSAAFSETNVNTLLSSPARQEIVRRLLRGDSAVWLLLESGEAAADAAAARLLQARLDHLRKTLKIAPLDPADLEPRAKSSAGQELKVAFSLLKLSRQDSAEQLLVRLLTSSEEDLKEEAGPIAVPVFGRGRALFAFAGKGINRENIDEACAFVVGPCACVVKEENPGFDLLLSADWDGALNDRVVADQPAPELSGFTAQETRSNQPSAKSAPRATPEEPIRVFRPKRPMAAGLLAAFSLTALAVISGTVWLIKRRR
jgi:hypothetical protein